MKANPTRHRRQLSTELAASIDKACDAFEADWKSNLTPRIEASLAACDPLAASALLEELLSIELAYREQRGQSPDEREYRERFPDYTDVVVQVFADHRESGRTSLDRGRLERDELPTAMSPNGGLHIRCPHCHNRVAIAVDTAITDITCSSCGSRISLVNDNQTTREASEIAIVGHFELVERLGVGGFGTVWKARDMQLDRTVAVKIPRKGQQTPDELAKFFREARAAAQLNHPNIVSVHEVGRDGDTVYIVSDLVRGVSLSSWLSVNHPTASEAAELCVTIADALEHAHRARVVHRDLKPHNILIDANGNPHLTDFGLAKRDSNEITMTIDGQVLGTPAYMSPEQARGEGHKADGRSDIYALGVILFELLTGELPFRGNAEMLLYQVLNDEPVSPRRLNRTIPRDLETVTLKCLEKDPSQRYQTAADVSGDLQRVLRDEPIQARRTGLVTKAWRWRRRNPAVAALLAAVACALVLGTLVSTYFAVKLASSEAEKTGALAKALIGRSESLRQARSEGYRDEVWDIIRRTQLLQTPDADPRLLRREAVGAMGDFVGLKPIDHTGFGADITAIAMHPSDAYMAVGMMNGAIRLVEPASGKSLGDLSGHTQRILALVFDLDGNRLISIDGANDHPGTVLSWKRTGEGQWQSERLVSLNHSYETARFTRDARFLLARSGTVADVWDLTDGSIKTSCTIDDLIDDAAHSAKLEFRNMSATFNPEQGLLAIAYQSRAGSVEESGFLIWDVQQRRETARRPLNLGWIYANGMSFSADGKILAVGSDRALIMYDVPTLQQRSSRRLDSIDAIDFSSDNQFLASADIRGSVRIWSISTGNEVANLSRPITGYSDQWLTFSHDGTYLASSNLDGLRLWHIAGTHERRMLVGHADSIPTVAFSPSGDSLATGSRDRTVAVWDSATGTQSIQLEIESMVQGIAFSPDGGLLAVCVSGGRNSSVQIWSIAAQSLVALATHTLEEVHSVTFVGERNLAASGEQGIAVWELPLRFDLQGAELASIPATMIAGSKCLNIAASQNGRFVAWPDNMSRVHVRDLTSSKPMLLDSPHMLQGWHGLAIFPDNSRLAFISQDGNAQLWNFKQGKAVRLTEDNTFRAPHIALSPDGKWLAGLATQQQVSVWNTETQMEAYIFRPERAAIWSLAWNRDATKLAVGLNDGGLVVWDLALVDQQLAQLGLR